MNQAHWKHIFYFQGAIGPDEKITTLGKSLSMLPVDISIGKMLLMGCVFEELQRVLTLAAALSIQSPFTNRAFRDQKCEVRSCNIFFI